MRNRIRVKVFQMQSSDILKENLEWILEGIRSAGKNADVCVFPEYSMLHPDYSMKDHYISSTQKTDGNFISSISAQCRESGVGAIVNFIEKSYGKPLNTSLSINSMGIINGRYSKTHLFDAGNYNESSIHSPGDTIPEPFGVSGIASGIEICYDIRFPELSRIYALKGAGIIFVQAGFYAGNLKYETWKTLLTARAMENGVFIVASAQCGDEFVGHSMIIGPDGRIISEAGNEPCSISAELDMNDVEAYRNNIHVLDHRRLDLYDVKGL